MPSAPLVPVLRQLRRIAAGSSAGRSDADLLAAFARSRDEAAFEELVRRYGPLVWRLCSRLLDDRHAAEDAFQATFLVLARKAGSLRWPNAVGCWLYGVARRVAGQLRRRRRIETDPQIDVAERSSRSPLDAVSGRELAALLDDELGRLPERLRAPLVLCYLEGRTRDKAAAQLGCSFGTLKRRLERGRAVLRARLERRGVGLPAALLSTVAAGAAAPPDLSAATVRAAVAFAAGRLAGSLPAVTAEAVLRPALVTKLRATALALVAGSLALAAGWGDRVGPDKEAGRDEEPPRPVAEVPPPAELGPPRLDRHGDPLPPGALARMGTVRLRHVAKAGNGTGAAFSPDGRSVLSWNEDELRLWDVDTGKLRWQFDTEWAINRTCFAPDSRTIAVVSGAGLVLVDAGTGRQLRVLSRRVKGFGPLAFAPDGRLLASSAEPPDSSAAAGGPPRPGPPRSFGIALWDTATGALDAVLPTDGKSLVQVAFAADGRTLTGFGRASESDWRRLKVATWDVPGRALRRAAEIEFESNGSRLSDDGRYVAAQAAQSREIRLWDATTGKEHGRLDEPGGSIQAFPGKTLAVLHSPDESADQELVIWDVAALKPLRRYTLPRRAGRQIEFAPDGRTFLSVLHSQMVFLWDAATGRRRLDVPAHDGQMSALGFTPDGRSLVSGGGESVRVWDPVTGEQRRAVVPPNPGGMMPALSPDGREALVNEGLWLRRFDLTTGAAAEPITVPTPADALPGDRYSINCLRYLPDGHSAVTVLGVSYIIPPGGSLRSVHTPWYVWDLKSGRPTATHTLPANVHPQEFSPDGTRLLAWATVTADAPDAPAPPALAKADPAKDEAGGSVYQQTVLYLFDSRTGRQLVTLRQPDHYQYCHAFSPDGQMLVTLTARYRREEIGDVTSALTAHVWEVRTGQEQFRLALRPTRLNWDPSAIAVAPDGRTVAVARRDGRLQFFDTPTGQGLPGRAGFDTPVLHMAFRPDGGLLATGHEDGTILTWDLTGLRPPALPAGRLDAAALEARWADLASADARRAYAALWGLVATPEQTVPLLADRVRPADPALVERVRRRIGELNSSQFRIREAASRELAELAEQVEPVLRESLRGPLTAEQRRRVEGLLSQPDVIRDPELLRALRAVEVLERIGTPEARQVLQRLVGGLPTARLTREAKAAIDRLDRSRKP
jgi:RNA polymerase sigma factor (sigma-70 family)